MLLDKIIKRIRNLTHERQKYVKRGYLRLSTRLDIDAVIDESDKIVQSDTRDISASGVYINTAGNKFEIGKGARVVFSIPGHDIPLNIPLKLHGEITRIEKDGMAIRFDDVNPYFKETLDDAIWKYKGR